MKDTGCTNEEIELIANEFYRLGILDDIYETIFDNINYVLIHQTVPKFWKYFETSEDVESGFYQFQLAICELHKECDKFHSILHRMTPIIQLKKKTHEDEYTVFNNMLKVALLSQLPGNFNEIVYSFYQTSFKVFGNSHQDVGRFRFSNILFCLHLTSKQFLSNSHYNYYWYY